MEVSFITLTYPIITWRTLLLFTDITYTVVPLRIELPFITNEQIICLKNKLPVVLLVGETPLKLQSINFTA